MIQETEVINLIASVFLLIYAQYLLRKFSIEISFIWLLFIAFLIGSYCFTVLEGFLFPSIFNFLEHASFTLASLCFLLAVSGKNKTA